MSEIVTTPTLPAARRWSWRGWPAGLYENHDGYHWAGADPITRAELDQALAAEPPENGPALLTDLVFSGHVELSDPSMTGLPARVFSAAPNAETALSVALWTYMFRKGAFTVDGQAAERPTAPVVLWRGCVPGFIHLNERRRVTDVDPLGEPSNPAEVVETRDLRRGMQWCHDPHQAFQWARRGSGISYAHSRNRHGQVFRAVVAPQDVLAVVGETTIIDPAGLLDLAVVA